MKKALSILLTLALLLGMLSACGSTAAVPAATAAPTAEAPAETAAPEVETADETDEFTQAVLDAFATANAKFAPGDIVCTVGGQKIDWQLYYYLLTDELLTVIYYMGKLPEDFNMAVSEDMTLQEYLKDAVLAKAKYYALANAKAEEMGVALTQEQLQDIETYIANLTEQYGGEEKLAQIMAESNLTLDLFRYILRSNDSLSALMESLYGASGEKMSDGDIFAWADGEGYVHVKHILYYTFNDDGTEMDETGKAEMRAKAEAALAELKALAGDREALLARFDELVESDSGDKGGKITFPDGYTFPKGILPAAFEEASFALNEYELSDIVETQNGYHLILRLPFGAEHLTLNQDANTGNYMTLRKSAANDLFARDLARWMEEAEVQWSEGFENLDLNALFDITPPAAEEKAE